MSRQSYAGTADGSGGSSSHDFQEGILTFAEGEMDYNDQLASDSASSPDRKKSIKSNSSLALVGPMDVEGSIKSLGSISLTGTFTVQQRVEAYGNLIVDGYLSCNDKIKCYGNFDISGTVYCGTKLAVYGQLTVNGRLEVHDTIEVWGALVIQGYMKCNKLVAYASVTTVDASYYDVEESETVWGAKMISRTADEADQVVID